MKMAVNAFFNEDKKTPIFLYSLNYYVLKLETKIIHRRVIWSFSKKKNIRETFIRSWYIFF